MPDEAPPGSDVRPGGDPASRRLTFEERLERALAGVSGESPNPSRQASARPRGKPVGLKTIPATVKGDEVAIELGRKLMIMPGTGALVWANRRRATAIDTTDFEAAFDDLVNPDSRSRWLAVLADMATFFGGGFLGYAINVMKGDKPSATVIAITLLAGLLLATVAIVIKRLD